MQKPAAADLRKNQVKVPSRSYVVKRGQFGQIRRGGQRHPPNYRAPVASPRSHLRGDQGVPMLLGRLTGDPVGSPAGGLTAGAFAGAPQRNAKAKATTTMSSSGPIRVKNSGIRSIDDRTQRPANATATFARRWTRGSRRSRRTVVTQAGSAVERSLAEPSGSRRASTIISSQDATSTPTDTAAISKTRLMYRRPAPRTYCPFSRPLPSVPKGTNPEGWLPGAAGHRGMPMPLGSTTGRDAKLVP